MGAFLCSPNKMVRFTERVLFFDAGGCGERFESPGLGSPTSEPSAFTIPPAEHFSLERKNHAITQKPSWIECSIGPKTGKVDDFQLFSRNPSTFSKQANRKVDDFQPFPRNPSTFTKQQPPKSMISSCFLEIHRLSQNRQTAKSMISSHFPEIHRLSAKKGLSTGDICRPEAGVPLWPVVRPMPAGGSAVKGRQRGGWLPVAERAP